MSTKIGGEPAELNNMITGLYGCIYFGLEICLIQSALFKTATNTAASPSTATLEPCLPSGMNFF